MGVLIRPLYSPALRMKAGELDGMRALARDVADCVFPRFIVPPSSERDNDIPLLFNLDRCPDVSIPLARAWGGRPALIDVTYILDEFGRDRAGVWLPKLYSRARARLVPAIPAAPIADILSCPAAFSSAIDYTTHAKLAFVLPFDSIAGSELPRMIADVMQALRVSAMDCIAIADFADAEFAEPTAVAPVISGAVEVLQDIGVWQQIIFQGSHYPGTNPAPKEGGAQIWPRNEWLAWCAAVKFGSMTAEHVTFGDYAADCSRIAFGSGRGKAIRHIPIHRRPELVDSPRTSVGR